MAFKLKHIITTISPSQAQGSKQPEMLFFIDSYSESYNTMT